MPGNPANIVIQKLQCQLQIEAEERSALENNFLTHLSAAEAEAKIAESKVNRLATENDQKDKTAKQITAYWQAYLAGLAAKETVDRHTYADLSEHARAACAWHGVQNEPTVRMCRWLHAH